MNENVPTLLCVDDDPDTVELLREYFTRQGFHVVTATNGVEALFQVQRHLPKAVILDLLMPRLGGLGALERIKRLDASIAIILISGHPDVLEMVTQASVSVAGAFTKPLDLAGMLRVLVQAGAAPLKATPAAAPQDRPPEVRPSSRRRVMVVDDDQASRVLLAGYLRRKGFEALEVGGGEEALRRIPEFRPHIILLDIAMPGMSGVETLQQIKVLAKETCVVMVSGIDEVETARRTLALGAADYVTKPVDFAYLDSVLEVHALMTQFDPPSE